MKHLSQDEAIKDYKDDPTQCPWCESKEIEAVTEHRDCGDIIQLVECPDCGAGLQVVMSVVRVRVKRNPDNLLQRFDVVRFLTRAEARELCGKPDEDGDYMDDEGSGIYALTSDMLRVTKGMRYRIASIEDDSIKLVGNHFHSHGIEPWMLKKVRK